MFLMIFLNLSPEFLTVVNRQTPHHYHEYTPRVASGHFGTRRSLRS
jgi:hypothetical protein